MRNFLAVFVLLLLTVGLTPWLVLRDNSQTKIKDGSSVREALTERAGDEAESRVYLLEENKSRSMSLFEFACGAVAAAMPVEYSDEAISALSLCVLTYADYCRARSQPIDCAVLDSSALRERWGDDYSANLAKIQAAVSRVMGFRLRYDNEPINAAWHSMSPGRTRAAAKALELPYLVSVSSDGDRLSPDFCEVKTFSGAQLSEALNCEQAEPQLECELSEEGLAESIELFSQKYSAEELYEYLNLRSPFFTVEEVEDGLQFKIFGCGEGLGLSCYGADYMARQGADFCEIVLHYFPDCIISAE